MNPSAYLRQLAEDIESTGDDWLEYLDSTGNIERYDGLCDCYVCRQIKADYFPWKALKEAAKTPNNQSCHDPQRQKHETI